MQNLSQFVNRVTQGTGQELKCYFKLSGEGNRDKAEYEDQNRKPTQKFLRGSKGQIVIQSRGMPRAHKNCK